MWGGAVELDPSSYSGDNKEHSHRLSVYIEFFHSVELVIGINHGKLGFLTTAVDINK